MGDFLRSLFSCFHRTHPEEELKFAAKQLQELVKYERMNTNAPKYAAPTYKFGIYLVPLNTPEEENVAINLLKQDTNMLEKMKDLNDSEFQKAVHSSCLKKLLESDKSSPSAPKAQSDLEKPKPKEIKPEQVQKELEKSEVSANEV